MTQHTIPLLSAPKPPRARFRDWLALTKPGATVLLVCSAVVPAWAASGLWVSWERLILLALSGGLAVAGVGVLNQFLERDIDACMACTAQRPLPAGRLPQPELALTWGALLVTLGLGLSLLTLSFETTLFIALGVFIYLLLYTCWLKRRSPWGVVLVGAARCCPILAGWAAVRADWPLTPFILAALVFFWTPANCWAYAMALHTSYHTAGFPVLPTVTSNRSTLLAMLSSVFPLVLIPLLGLSGLSLWVASAGAMLLLAMNLAMLRRVTAQRAWYFYQLSNSYLILVFLSLIIGI